MKAAGPQALTSDDSLEEALLRGLEAARKEAVRRLQESGRPTTTLVARRGMIGDARDPHRWREEMQSVQTSPLATTFPSDWFEETESSMGHRATFTDQLAAVSERMGRESSAGLRSPLGATTLPDAAENALVFFVSPMARAYLRRLPDLTQPDLNLARTLAGQLATLMAPDSIDLNRAQWAVDGVVVSESLSYRGVHARALTPVEIGAIWEQDTRWFRGEDGHPDFVVPSSRARGGVLLPRTLLEWIEEPLAASESATGVAVGSRTHWHNRLALAFFLRGHDIGSVGTYALFQEPRWFGFGTSHVRSDVGPRPCTEPTRLTEDEFAAVIDLAERIPTFGFGVPDSGVTIALARLLRACGTTEQSSFLDLAITLEAALLGDLGVAKPKSGRSELAFRFKLYGAAYLRSIADPVATFSELGKVYDARSRVVHGSAAPELPRIKDAEEIARRLALAVVRQAVETEWPDSKDLETRALEALRSQAA